MPSVHRINLTLAVTFIYLCYSYALFSERVMDRFSTNSNFMEFVSPLAFVGSWIAEETVLVQEARLLSYEIDRFERTYTTEQVEAVIGMAREPALEKLEFRASVGGHQSDVGVPYADVMGVNSNLYLGAVLSKAILHNCQNELNEKIEHLGFWERAILKRPGSLEYFSDVQGYESLRRRACGKMAIKAFSSHRHRVLLPTHIREAANLPRHYTTHNRLPMMITTTSNHQQEDMFVNYSLFMTPRERRVVDRTHRWWISADGVDVSRSGEEEVPADVHRRQQVQLQLLAPVVYGVDTYTQQLTRTSTGATGARSEITITALKDGVSGDGDQQTATLLKARASNTMVRAAAWRLLLAGGGGGGGDGDIPQGHHGDDSITNPSNPSSSTKISQLYRDVTTERSIAVSRGALEGCCLISGGGSGGNMSRPGKRSNTNMHQSGWMIDISAEVPDVVLPISTNNQQSPNTPHSSINPSIRHALVSTGTQYDDENSVNSAAASGGGAELNPLLWEVGTESDEGEAFEINSGMPRAEIHRSLLGRVVGSLQSRQHPEEEGDGERSPRSVWGPSDSNTDDLLKRAEEEVFLHSRLIKHKVLHTPATVRAVMGRSSPTTTVEVDGGDKGSGSKGSGKQQQMKPQCSNNYNNTNVWSIPTHTSELLLSTLDLQKWPQHKNNNDNNQQLSVQHQDELLTAFVQSFVLAGRLSMATRIGADTTTTSPPPSMACLTSVIDLLDSKGGLGSINNGGDTAVDTTNPGRVISELLEKRHRGSGGGGGVGPGGCVGGERSITTLLADNPILSALVSTVIKTGISAQVASVGEILRNMVGSGAITPSTTSSTIPFPHLRLLTPPLNAESLHSSSKGQRKALVDLVVAPRNYRRQFTTSVSTTTNSCKGSGENTIQAFLSRVTGGATNTGKWGEPERLCEVEQTTDQLRNQTVLTDSTLFAAIWRLSQSVGDDAVPSSQPPPTTLELASFSSASIPVMQNTESTPRTLFSTLAARASRAHSPTQRSHHHVWLAHHQLSHNRLTGGTASDLFSQCQNQSVVGSSSLAHVDVKVACNYAFAMESLLDTTTARSHSPHLQQQQQQQSLSRRFVASNYYTDLTAENKEEEGLDGTTSTTTTKAKGKGEEEQPYHLQALRQAMKTHCGSLIRHPPNNNNGGPLRLNTKILPAALPTSSSAVAGGGGSDMYDVEKEGTVSNALHETYFITPTARQCINWLQEYRRALSSFFKNGNRNSLSTPTITTSSQVAALRPSGLERLPPSSLPRRIDMVYYDAHDVTTTSHKTTAAFDPLAIAAAQLQAILSSTPVSSVNDLEKQKVVTSSSSKVRSVLVRLPFFMDDAADRVCETIIHATAGSTPSPLSNIRSVDLVVRESAMDHPQASSPTTTTSPWSVISLWKKQQQRLSPPEKFVHEVCHRRSLVSESFYELEHTAGKWEEQLLWVRWRDDDEAVSPTTVDNDNQAGGINDIDSSDVSTQHRTPLFNIQSDQMKQQDKHQKSRLVHGVVVMGAMIKELREHFPQLAPTGGNSAAADEGLLEGQKHKGGGGKERSGGGEEVAVDATSLSAMRSQHRYLRNELTHALQGAIILQRDNHAAAAAVAITEAVAARDRLIADFGLVKNKKETSSSSSTTADSKVEDKYSKRASLLEEGILGNEVANIASGGIPPIIVAAADAVKSASSSSPVRDAGAGGTGGGSSVNTNKKPHIVVVGGSGSSTLNTEDAAAGGQTWGSILVIVAALGTVTALLWAFGKNFRTPTRKGARKQQPQPAVDASSADDIHRRQR